MDVNYLIDNFAIRSLQASAIFSIQMLLCYFYTNAHNNSLISSAVYIADIKCYSNDSMKDSSPSLFSMNSTAISTISAGLVSKSLLFKSFSACLKII